jgi:pyrimidine operon attenuation protein/uracil phosphoribosyltransferase
LKTIIEKSQLQLTIQRLAHQLLENHADSDELVFIGIQLRGVRFSDRLMEAIRSIRPAANFHYGKLDITFYRDDIRRELHVANKTEIDFPIEGKQVILIDDVLYTGRTVRAALDALQDFGRPASVRLCVLVDRKFNRELPIQPDYFGRAIDSLMEQEVKVSWENETVELY